MLIWIDKRDAPLSPEDIDKTISAEMSDKSLYPIL
jgi:hypothetical protein